MNASAKATVHKPDHKLGFIRRYIFSFDHKVVGLQYFFTAMAMAVFGGALSMLMRLQLGWPAQAWPALGKILPVGMAGGYMAPEFYLSLQTMHGTIMAIFVLTAVFTGGFGNYLIPLQIGARDMAFPFLNMLSYWVYALSCVVLVLAFFVEGGAPISGWTAYPPLSAVPSAGPGEALGQDLWLVAIALFTVSSMMGVLNYITTILFERTRGMSMMRVPLNIWGMLASSIISLVTFPVLLAAGVLLLADRLLGTSFFLPAGLVIGEKVIERIGGHPLLWQHLFWYFGHPEVYIVIVPAMGIAAEIVASFIRKPVFGYKVMAVCWMAIVVLSVIVWGHHMFVSGMNPFLGSVFAFTTLLITVPSAILVLCWVASLWGANIQFNSPMLFALGFVSVFVTGGLGGFFLGSALTDVPLHDTYFVIGHFHLTMALSPLFAMFAGVYYWFPRFFNRMMNERLAKTHFWFTIIGAYAVFLTMHVLGIAGMIRHSYDPTQYEIFQRLQPLNRFVSYAAFVLASAQLIFLFNFFWSFFRGPRSVANPWRTNTLEWTAPTPIPHGNWGESTPVVCRWPYDYGVAGTTDDFVPQNAVPAGAKSS
ncbi:MAG TPA: cbb3-type cytochrome c oxidase subunit I [Terriglobia bacterium]|nr:cbb3-type cytochrome c oxidase subunit I [Terriglobia bacterium]